MKHYVLNRRKRGLFNNSEHRRTIASSLIVLSTAAVCLVAAREPVHAEKQLTAQEIINRAVARAEAQYESQAELSFEWESRSVVQSLDSENRVTKTERNRYRLYPVHGAVV